MGDKTPGKIDPGAVDPKDNDSIYTAEHIINSMMSGYFIVGLNEMKMQAVELKGKLNDLPAIANREKVSAGISWHCDAAANAGANGLTIYYSGSQAAGRLALAVADSIRPTLNKYSMSWRGIKTHPKRLIMLNNTAAPWLLIEAGFLSNPQDEKTLNKESYQKDLAHATARGVAKFLNVGFDKPSNASAGSSNEAPKVNKDALYDVWVSVCGYKLYVTATADTMKKILLDAKMKGINSGAKVKP